LTLTANVIYSVFVALSGYREALGFPEPINQPVPSGENLATILRTRSQAKVIGPRCSTRRDAKCQEEARGDQRLVAHVFMKHDEAGQDSASVEIKTLRPFRNGDVIGTANSETDRSRSSRSGSAGRAPRSHRRREGS
jgi:hypothetical protein